MVYLTNDAKNNAESLGIDKNGMSKLYRISKNVNKFLKDFEQGKANWENELEDEEYEQEG